MRLLVVMIVIVAKSKQISGNRSRQMEPAWLFVALRKIWSRGPAVELMTSCGLPATKRRTVRKMKPVKTPMATQAIMILGPSTLGFGISSIMCATAS